MKNPLKKLVPQAPTPEVLVFAPPPPEERLPGTVSFVQFKVAVGPETNLSLQASKRHVLTSDSVGVIVFDKLANITWQVPFENITWWRHIGS